MQDTPQSRTLKVYPLYIDGPRDAIVRSQIRLMGKWLLEAGFLPNTLISVEVKHRRLIIRPYVQG